MTIDKNSSDIDATALEEIRTLFLRQAAGETAHDIEVIDAVLARAYCFWGRKGVLDHFRAVFAGTWRFEPDESAIRTPDGWRISAIVPVPAQ
jgi:hypothetical protein